MTSAAFTVDASSALSGPGWLRRRRAEAAERFSAQALPSEAEEIWRYSGIDRFDLDAFSPSSPSATPDVAFARSLAEPFGARSALVVTSNGAVVAHETSPAVADGQLTVSPLLVAAEAPATLGTLAPAGDAFASLHDAFVADVVSVTVAAKVVLAEPVVVVHLVERPDPSSPAAAFPHLLLRVGTSASATVVEMIATSPTPSSIPPSSIPPSMSPSSTPSAVLVVPVAELEIDDDARLAYANLQMLDHGCTEVAVQASRVGRDATLRSFTVGLGGRYARVRTDSDLAGTGGRSSLLAAYLGTDDQIHDFRTLQDHHAPRTESELLFTGAVADEARSVYSGLIHIRNGARGANAFQTNHNLVLSEGAHADSVPNLDIEENDVRCSHASTVGPIDDEQRYYLESRGIDPAVAERLIVLGFFSDITARAPLPGVSELVDAALRQRLSGRLPAERLDGATTGALADAPGTSDG